MNTQITTIQSLAPKAFIWCTVVASLTTFSHVELTLPADSLSTSNFVDCNQYELLNSGTALPTW